MSKKIITGTLEWACLTANCILGCANACKYCYACSIAIRFKRKTAATWPTEEARPRQVLNVLKGNPTKVMFPSTHDITPGSLDLCIQAITALLNYGHELLIVSKPRSDCIRRICDEFAGNKDKILFRFTIGSANNDVLKFWEPNAPSFQERVAALQLAYSSGFQTSISCEPMLDQYVERIVEAVLPFTTDSIWIGKANQLRARLKINGADADTLKRGEDLIAMQNDDRIRDTYARLQHHPKIKWKESIKKVVGIEIPKEAGLDI